MNDKQLQSFYRLIALEEFEQALGLIKAEIEITDKPERIIIQAVKLKQQLKKYLSFEAV